MFNKKQIIILLVLIAILTGAIFLYRLSYDRWPWQESAQVATPTATASLSPSENLDPRVIVMNDAAAKISQISPEQPVLGGHWFADRFWFIDGSYSTFYVEYEDGHILRRLLLTADLSKPDEISYHIEAFFEPGESDWVLKSGKDQNSGLPLILFENDSTSGLWVQKN